MQYLNDLVHFLNEKGRLTRAVDAAVAGQSHVQELLKYLKTADAPSTEAASMAVFGSENDDRLPKTKTLLKNQIINGILLKGVGKMRPLTECYRLYAAAYTLWRNGGRELAIPLLEAAYRKALKIEEVEVIVLTSEKLAYHYGTFQPDRQKWMTYKNARDRFTSVLEAQRMIVNLYQDFNVHKGVTKQGVSIKRLQEELETYDERSAPLEMPPLAQFFRLSLEIDYLVSTDTLPINYLDDRLAQNEKLFTQHPVTHRHLLIQLMLVRIVQQEFEQARATLQIVRTHTQKWPRVIFQTNNEILAAILNFHKGTYEMATKHLDLAVTSKGYKWIAELTKEQIVLMKLIISLVVDPVTHENLVRKWKLRISKFVNEMDSITHDKTGDNVLVYCAEVIWYIHYRQYSKADERIAALERYAVRHKLRRANPRYYYLTRLLAAASQGNYHPAATRRKAAGAWAKLQRNPLQRLDLTNPEFIPVEHLWDAVLRKLD